MGLKDVRGYHNLPVSRPFLRVKKLYNITMGKLDEETKYFWTNLFQGILIVVGASILFSWAGLGGFWMVSAICTVILVFKVASDFTNTAFPKKDKMSR